MEPTPSRRDPWPVVGLAAAVAFVILAAVVVRRGGLPFDEPVIVAVRGLGLPSDAWAAITSLGGRLLVPVGAALVLAAALTGRLRLALVLAVALIGATLFTDLAKDLVARARPTGEHLVRVSGYSFPSGHSLNSATTYGLLAVVAWRSRLPVLLRRGAVVAGFVLPFCIGLSRIALSVHYPSDVLGGWLAGIALVAAGATAVRLLGAMDRGIAGTSPVIRVAPEALALDPVELEPGAGPER